MALQRGCTRGLAGELHRRIPLEPWGPEDVLETFYVVERPQYVQIMRAELCTLCRADYRAKGMIPYEQ